MAAVHVKTPHENEPAPEGRLNGPPRIVLLDDVPEVRKSIRTIFHAEWADAKIAECENGDEAWAMLQSSPPDLFITDLTHPGLGGEELSKRLADAHPKLPVLVISAFQEGLDSLREQHRADPRAPRRFLAKPFTPKAVPAAAGRFMKGDG